METKGKLGTITVECKNERNNPMEAPTAQKNVTEFQQFVPFTFLNYIFYSKD